MDCCPTKDDLQIPHEGPTMFLAATYKLLGTGLEYRSEYEKEAEFSIVKENSQFYTVDIMEV